MNLARRAVDGYRRRLKGGVVCAGTVALLIIGAAPATATGTNDTQDQPAKGDNVVLQWNQQIVSAMRATSASAGKPIQPTVGARNLAVVHTCIYDAWAAYDRVAVGTHTRDSLRRPVQEHTTENKREAVSFAAHTALSDLFPAQRTAFDTALRGLGYEPGMSRRAALSPAHVGMMACNAVLTARHADGANQLGTPAYSDPSPSYVPANAPQPMDAFNRDSLKYPDRWTPMDHGHGSVQQFMTPHYGGVRPFVLGSVDSYAPPAPPAYGTPAANAAIDEVVEVSANLTDQRKAIAEFWQFSAESSASIPQRWAQFASQRDGHTLDDDVKMFFALNVVAHDANVVLWKTKRGFNYSRPIAMVRYAKYGQNIQAWGGPGVGTQTIEGSTWRPFYMSPPFPGYVSGHASTTSAGAELLKLYTGSSAYGASETIKAGSSKVEPGITPATDVVLHWDTFDAAASEVADSRLYGGVHFSMENKSGMEQGQRVARDVWSKVQKYFDGTA